MVHPLVMESASSLAPKPRRIGTPSADESATILAAKLRAREPFFFVLFGDGAIECMSHRKGMTCDREPYTEALGAELLVAWLMLKCRSGGRVLVGDWQSASFDGSSEHARYAEEYALMLEGWQPEMLHFESLLLMRESAALVDFYRAVKEDPRKKLYMGPVECGGAAKMLGAEHLPTPMHDLFGHVGRLTRELERKPFDVLLYGAGMAGNIPAVRSWVAHPERTYINLGSGIDPLFFGRKTRRQQISPERARVLFKELL